MTIGILNWKLRDTSGEITPDRGWMLLNLYWRTNAHMRCWPGMKRIAKDCGIALATADKTMDWLVERGAVIKVPYEHRHLEEKKLHQRKTIYQLTGVIKIKDAYMRYIEVQNPETIYTIATLVSAFNISLAEIMRAEFSVAKIIASETEGIKESSEGISNSEGDTRESKTRARKKATPTPTPIEEKTDASRQAPEDPTPDAADPPPHVVPRGYTEFERANIVPPYQRAYEDAIGALVILPDSEKDLVIAAHRKGYKPTDVDRVTRAKMIEKNGAIPVFRFVIQDLHRYPAPKATTPKKVYQAEPPVQLSPEKLAQRIEDMKRVRAKITEALQ